jgi:hypothetical protein
MNQWHAQTPPLVPGTTAKAEDVNDKVSALDAAFDKLPAPHATLKGFAEPIQVGEPTAQGQATTKAFVETAMTSQVNQAATSATNAANSATAAAGSESNAAGSATNAASSATAAANSASAAANSATQASSSATNAANSATAAAGSATDSAASATNSANSATAANTAKTGAEAARDKAMKWADEAQNIEVEIGKFSARHWAQTIADLNPTPTNVANTIVKRDASGGFAAGTVTATLSGNATTATTLQTARLINGVSFNGSANINVNTVSALTAGAFLTGGSFNGSAAVTLAVDATSANTASKVVSRDASGNFSAGTITAALVGNASSATTAAVTDDVSSTAVHYPLFAGATSGNQAHKASSTKLRYVPSTGAFAAPVFEGPLTGNATSSTKLQNARLINGVAFDGTADITIPSNTPNSLTAGAFLTGGSFNGSAAVTFAVDATSTNTASKVVARDASGNFAASTITAALQGNATTATTLQTARLINGVSFNGSANITVTANTPNTLTRGSYLTGANFNGSAATTWAVDATTTNTADKVVARDASGNFAAGTITASLSGNATTATTATTATNANNVAVTDDNVTNTTYYPTFSVGASGNQAQKVSASKLTWNPSTAVLSAPTFSGALQGNATTATTLQTARLINGVSFNGSANITVTANTPNALTAGSGLTGGTFNGSAAVTFAADYATQNEGIAGTNNTKVMTPLRVKEAIDVRNFPELLSQLNLSDSNLTSVQISLAPHYAKYRNFLLKVDRLVGTSDGASPVIRISVGSTPLSAVGTYHWNAIIRDFAGASAERTNGDTTALRPFAEFGINNTNLESSGCLDFRIINANTLIRKFFMWEGVASADATLQRRYHGGGVLFSNVPIDYIWFALGSGNIKNGTFSLYGLP